MNNKSMLDIKEQALEKIKSLQKLEPDYILSWLSGLTDLEQKVVANLYQINKAVTIKEIMNQIIINTFYAIMLKDGLHTHNFPFKSYFEIAIADNYNLLSSLRKLHPDLSAQISKLKKEFKFPSFRRIDKSIQDLMSMGIVLAREEKLENKKIKGLYYLNPIIRTQLNKIKNKN